MLQTLFLTLWAMYWVGVGVCFTFVIIKGEEFLKKSSTSVRVVLVLSVIFWPIAVFVGWIGEKFERK